VVKLGSIVAFNDVLIGIVFHDTKTDTMLDKSVIYPKVGACKVVNVQHATNKYGVDSVSVTLQQIYNTQVKVGDKLASTHSQKGVVVAIVCASEMPVVAEGPNMGMPVDIIFNPQGLPTRMTPGAVEEGAMGLYAAKFGKRVNATVFETKPDLSREDFVAQFGDAKVAMMNPSTGQLYPSKVAVLLSSYYRLDQLASEKLQVRDGGPKDPYNQPKAGKANNGGLRVGLMEGAAFVGHGATEGLYERHVLMSDAGSAFVCSNSDCSNVNGDPIVGNADSGLCRLCNAYTCKRVDMPYTTACLVNHLESAGIHWSLKLEKVDQQGLKGAWADESLGSSILPHKPHQQHQSQNQSQNQHQSQSQHQNLRKRKHYDKNVHTSNNYNGMQSTSTTSQGRTRFSRSDQASCYPNYGRSGNYKDAMALHGGPFSGPSVSIERPSSNTTTLHAQQARPFQAGHHPVHQGYKFQKHRQQHEVGTPRQTRPTNTEEWTSSDDSDDDLL
jgi:hypothetical protein